MVREVSLRLRLWYPALLQQGVALWNEWRNNHLGLRPEWRKANLEGADLDVLSPEASLELLASLVGYQRIDAELELAEALCEWLGYLPLGLELVGGYLDEHPTLTLAKIQAQLEQKKLEAHPLEPAALTARVAAAFELTWDDLPPEAQQLGYRLSLFAPAALDWSLLEKCAISTRDEAHRKKATEKWENIRERFLVNRHLLQLTQQKTYRLHPLIRERLQHKLVPANIWERANLTLARVAPLIRGVFRARLATLAQAEQLKREFCQAMVAVAQELPPTPNREQMATVIAALPHLVEAATVLIDWVNDEDLICVADSLNKLAQFYSNQGRYDEAEPLLVQALELRQRLLGSLHPDVAISLWRLAALYRQQRRYLKAMSLYQQALAIAQRHLGRADPHTVSIREYLEFLQQKKRLDSYQLKAGQAA